MPDLYEVLLVDAGTRWHAGWLVDDDSETDVLLRDKGLASGTIRKMAVGSAIGTLVSIPLGFFLGWLGSVTSKEFNRAKYAEMEVRSLTGHGVAEVIDH